MQNLGTQRGGVTCPGSQSRWAAKLKSKPRLCKPSPSPMSENWEEPKAAGGRERVCQSGEAKWGWGPAPQGLGATGQRAGVAPRPQ